jgi:hypothetical protein
VSKVSRNQIVGIRATNDFVLKLDDLCHQFGRNRSEVIRYCLNKFINEHLNNPTSFQRASAELY